MTATDSYERFVWRETSPGVWKRSVDELEFYYAAQNLNYEQTGRKELFIMGHLTLDFDAPTDASVSLQEAESRVNEALRKGWRTLHYDHPTLASWIERDPTTGDFVKIYDNNDQAALDKTFEVLPADLDPMQWVNGDHEPKLPTIYVLPKTAVAGEPIRRDVFLRAGHETIDGGGMWTLFGNWLKYADQAYAQGDAYVVPQVDGSESSRLSPPLRVAAGLDPQPNEAQGARLANIGAEFAKTAPAPDTKKLTIPFDREATSSHSNYARVRVSKEDTSKIIKAAKAQGFSVNHAFHAAVPLAVLRLHHQDEAEEDKPVTYRYGSLMPRDERGNCLAPYNTPQHPVSLYHSVSPLFIPVDVSLAPKGSDAAALEANRRAQYQKSIATIKEYYEMFKTDPDFLVVGLALWTGVWPVPALSEGPCAIPKANQDPAAGFSTHGRIDTMVPPRQGVIGVSDPWATGSELDTTFNSTLTGFDGRVTYTTAYNSAYHKEEDVYRFLQATIDEVKWQWNIE